MENQKKTIITQYLQTRLTGVAPARQALIVDRISDLARLQVAKKHQELELEGRALDGRAWLSVDAMVHGFYHCESSGDNWGNLIWKKMELILFPISLIEDEYRKNYIQLLEPGRVLSIGYPDLLKLRNEFVEIEKHIEHISMLNEKAYQRRVMLLNEPSKQRIKVFEAENPLFMTVASNEIKAMHLGLTRQGYNLLRKKSDQGK